MRRGRASTSGAKLQERLNPPVYGWHNVRNPNFVAQEQIVFRTGAVKYEAGTHNLLGLVGLIAAMELALEIGVENIAAELLRKRAWLVPALQAKGFTVLNADAKPENASGIVSFYQPGKDLAAAAQKTDGRRHRHLAADGSPGTKLHPPLAAFLQHRRGIAARAGIVVGKREVPRAGFEATGNFDCLAAIAVNASSPGLL